MPTGLGYLYDLIQENINKRRQEVSPRLGSGRNVQKYYEALWKEANRCWLVSMGWRE